MTFMWIILGLGVLGFIIARTGRSRTRGQRPDLGSVSDQWIAEHRSHSQNPPR